MERNDVRAGLYCEGNFLETGGLLNAGEFPELPGK
jgi:hypothetical protein